MQGKHATKARTDDEDIDVEIVRIRAIVPSAFGVLPQISLQDALRLRISDGTHNDMNELVKIEVYRCV